MVAAQDATVPADVFRAGLLALGIETGMSLFVHSAFDQMGSVAATPFEVATALCELVGNEGTVTMPTFPMRGRSQRYLDLGMTFDVRRTPSQSGIVTEVFRRMRGTCRSVHPTHPVAARGRHAMSVTESHWRSSTPFDEHSPFARLLSSGAFILRLGAFDAMTFRHLADHRLQDRIPYPVYSDRQVVVTTIDASGTVRKMTTRAHNERLRVDHIAVMDEMRRSGNLREALIGVLPVSLVGARQYVAAYEAGVAQGLVRFDLVPDVPSSPRT
jgi:aminoglycoside N3'-acetyltransferase